MTWTELDEEKHSLADRLKSIAFTDSKQFMDLIGQLIKLHVSEVVAESEAEADTLLASQCEEIKRLGEAHAVADAAIVQLVASLALSKERIEELEMRLAEVDRG